MTKSPESQVGLKCVTGAYIHKYTKLNTRYFKAGTLGWKAWREHIDRSVPPWISKNSIADSASGRWHRWVAGHDLLIDIPRIAKEKGFKESGKHFLHIIRTDFPTKDGVPIPGFSKSGLGEFLAGTHKIIPKKCLNISLFPLCNGITSIFVTVEGFADLIQALAGNLQMSPAVFFDTFGEGAFELILGIAAPRQCGRDRGKEVK